MNNLLFSDEMMPAATQPGPPPPPPPAPPALAPPPPQVSTKVSPVKLHKHQTQTKLSPVEAINQALDRFSKLNQSLADHKVYCANIFCSFITQIFQFLCFNHHKDPLLQEGPQCGIVALTMAGTSRGETLEVEEVQREAVRRGFTSRGEMFSVENMAELARTSLGRQARVEAISRMRDTTWLLDILTSGQMLLVPYDCGHNHGPSLHGGKKAHWALITGFVIAGKHLQTENIKSFLLEQSVGNNLVIDTTSDAVPAVKKVAEHKAAKAYLIAR